MELSLNGLNWQVKGFWPWVPLMKNSAETGMELMGVTDWIPATVPGGVHADLFRAGLIPNPYVDRNSLLCEWVENRWWVYKTSFPRPELQADAFVLEFKGLDYEATIYLNGRVLGEHKGMYHPAVFDITERLAEKDTAELLVVLRHAPDEMSQIGKTSMTYTQKSRFNYKWDFSTRLVNLGIWDDVVLKAYAGGSLEDVQVRTDARDGSGIVSVAMSMAARGAKESASNFSYRIRLNSPSGASVLAEERAAIADSRTEFELVIPQPELWFPNGYGAQPLYELRIALLENGMERDDRVHRVGIRSLGYQANENSPEGALPYTFVVNGKKIYIKGVNLTPLDHLYGNVSDDRYGWMIRLAAQGNINMIRVWGGGIIEKKRFYELCDEHGIMVWQEFIQSSSGIDNIPSKRPEFLELLERTAINALRERANHTSLSVWSGGNELMSEPDTPSTYDDENLAMLKSLVEAMDPQRLFLPTSASGPVQYITEKKGVSHDIHGHWKFQGNPRHYELYAQSDSLFHSEFGVDGVSAAKSIRKFLSDTYQKPVSMESNLVWRHHGEWWDTFDRDRELFGAVDDLATFAECSQWIQAEGLRFILEANRRRKFRNSGSIIWQLNEPWPNVSCTNLIDYFGEAKMAYYWVRKAFAPDHVSLDYRDLRLAEGSRFEGSIHAHRSGPSSDVFVRAEVLDTKGNVWHEQELEGRTLENRALELGRLGFTVPQTERGLVFVRLTLTGGKDVLASSNLYVFSTRGVTLYASALALKGSNLAVEAMGDWISQPDGTVTRAYRIENTGTEAALHVYPEETGDAYWLTSDHAYETLFPGESVTYRVVCKKKSGGLFDWATSEENGQASQPRIAIRWFGQETMSK